VAIRRKDGAVLHQEPTHLSLCCWLPNLGVWQTYVASRSPGVGDLHDLPVRGVQLVIPARRLLDLKADAKIYVAAKSMDNVKIGYGCQRNLHPIGLWALFNFAA
jgi:hypothetical protein